MNVSMVVRWAAFFCFAVLNVLSFQFIDLKYEDLNSYISELKGKYGDIRTASELYGLPAAKDVSG